MLPHLRWKDVSCGRDITWERAEPGHAHIRMCHGGIRLPLRASVEAPLGFVKGADNRPPPARAPEPNAPARDIS
ncbi:hypothetical protein GCM10027091_58830 [Streptomyces daliensis]